MSTTRQTASTTIPFRRLDCCQVAGDLYPLTPRGVLPDDNAIGAQAVSAQEGHYVHQRAFHRRYTDPQAEFPRPPAGQIGPCPERRLQGAILRRTQGAPGPQQGRLPPIDPCYHCLDPWVTSPCSLYGRTAPCPVCRPQEAALRWRRRRSCG